MGAARFCFAPCFDHRRSTQFPNHVPFLPRHIAAQAIPPFLAPAALIVGTMQHEPRDRRQDEQGQDRGSDQSPDDDDHTLCHSQCADESF